MKFRFDVWYIAFALVCFLAAQGFGHEMAQSQNHTLFPAHAHLALLGWVSAALFGILHRLYPALGTAKLALPQFGLWVLAIPVFTYGIARVLLSGEQDPLFAIIGEIMVIIATVLFVIMFAGKVLLVKPTS